MPNKLVIVYDYPIIDTAMHPDEACGVSIYRGEEEIARITGPLAREIGQRLEVAGE